MKRTKAKFKHKNKYIPLALFLIIFVILVDILALVLYSDSKTYQDIPDYYPGQTDPIKVDEIKIDYPIKPTGEICNKDVVDDLINKAENVKFSYEPYIRMEGPFTDPEGDEMYAPIRTINVVIENITEDLKVTVRDNYVPSHEGIYTYSNSENGIVKFEPYTTVKKVRYDVVISSANSSCGEQVIKRFNIEAPMINELAVYDFCFGMDHIKECAYFTWEQYDIDKTIAKIAEAQKTTTTTTANNQSEIPDDNENTTKPVTNSNDKEFELDKTMQIIILIGIIIILIIVIVTFFMGKKRGN